MEPIRLVVADIDGCLSKGSTFPYSPHLIERLVAVNTEARTDRTVPPITFCTGRPQPYVECLIQVTHGYQPALCEAGIVLFDPIRHAVLTHPDFGQRERQVMAELKHLIDQHLLSDKVMFEPGKITHHTLLLSEPLKPTDLIDEANELVAQFDGLVEVEMTKICLHFLFRHLHKGAGIEWLADYTGVPLSQMAGIGDARPDLPFLKKVAMSYAPSEAHQDVKEICTLVSDQCDADAMIELLEASIKRNRNGARFDESSATRP